MTGGGRRCTACGRAINQDGQHYGGQVCIAEAQRGGGAWAPPWDPSEPAVEIILGDGGWGLVARGFRVGKELDRACDDAGRILEIALKGKGDGHQVVPGLSIRAA